MAILPFVVAIALFHLPQRGGNLWLLKWVAGWRLHRAAKHLFHLIRQNDDKQRHHGGFNQPCRS
jgi:hypothetical protein